jgi:hypothetical protein
MFGVWWGLCAPFWLFNFYEGSLVKALDVIAPCQDGVYRNNVSIDYEGSLISITRRFQFEVLNFSDALFVEGFDDAVVAVRNQVINVLANDFFNLVCIS